MADDFDDDRPRRRRRYDDRDDDDRRPPPPPPKSNTGLIIGILVGVFVVVCGGGGILIWQVLRAGKAVVAQAQVAVQQAQAKMQTEADTAEARENLKQIGVALQEYPANGRFPNDSYGLGPKKAGVPTPRPLLSWRVHILPHIGYGPLYRQFKLDEPWDSVTNKPLVDRMPDVYGGPAAQVVSGPGKTFYRGFSHEGAVFEKPRVPGLPNPVTIQAIVDGTRFTIAVVESAEAIEWTRPDELEWGPGKPRPKFGGADPNREFFLALTADGQVHRVRMTVPDQSLRDLIHRMDGRVIAPGWEFP